MSGTAPRKAVIDWDKVRQRLARARAALDGDVRPPPEKAQAVLDERARVLARVPVQAVSAAEVVEVLIFALGNERYALETHWLREVLRLQEWTPLPATPDFLLGITNVRGLILPVFDLRRFFGVPGQEPTVSSRVLVLGRERSEFGVLADEVVEVVRLQTAEVLEAPGSVAGIARAYLRGVTEKALIVLDGAFLLNDARLIIDQGEDGKPATRGAL